MQTLFRKELIISLIAGFVTLVAAHFMDLVGEQEVYLTLEYTSDSKLEPDLAYIDVVDGIIGGNKIVLTPGDEPHLSKAFLPNRQIGVLLLKFGEETGSMRILGANLVNQAGTYTRKIEFGKSVKGYNIENQPLVLPDGIHVRIENSSEKPTISLPIAGRPLEHPPIRWVPRGGPILLGVIASIIAGAFLVYQRSTRFECRTFCATHPKLTVWIVAFFAAFISVAPVFISGRGMVGPYLAYPLLYDGLRTFPGQSEEILTPTSPGGDVGALLYSALGQMRQASLGFLESKEVLLWDRFNSGGATYLGQGMFVYLCPFVWPVLLGAGTISSWTWAFVMAKFLFSAAFGMYLVRLRIALPLVLAATVASAYLGMFTFRTGHFAYFSMCGFPLIMLGLDGVISHSRSGYKRLVYLAIWMVGCSSCFFSGALKEGALILISSNLIATAVALVRAGSYHERLMYLARALTAAICFVLISAPMWLVFICSLGNYETVYDFGLVRQLPKDTILSIFDDLYIRLIVPRFSLFSPSLNLLFLPGCLFALVALYDKTCRALLIVPVVFSLLCLAFSFEIAPGELLLRVPFLGSLMTAYNGLGISALPGMMLASVIGWQKWTDQDFCTRYPWFRKVGLILLGVTLLAGSWSQFKISMTALFPWILILIIVLIASTFALPVLVWIWRLGLIRTSRMKLLSVTVGIFLVVILICRFAYYTYNSAIPFLIVLPERIKGEGDSTAVAWLQEAVRSEPARVTGVGDTMRSGINTYFGLEGVGGAMPLRNPYYWEFISKAAGGQAGFVTVALRSDYSRHDAPFLEFLNCRYVVGMPGQVYAGGGPPVVHSSDLEVRELPLAWPRAFFVDEIRVIDGVDAFVNLVNQRPGPFCAVSTEIRAANPLLEPLIAEAPDNPPEVVPARDYELTLNNTSFTVEAGGPGMIVLHEAFEPGVFQVRVNGQPAELLRVNHAFRGLQVPAAGTYRVEYRYWPPVLTVALWMSAAGGVLLVAFGAYLWLSKRDTHAHPPSPDPQPGH